MTFAPDHDRIRGFALLLSLGLAAAFLVFRLGFPLRIGELAAALSFFVFVVFTPPLAWTLIFRAPPQHPSDYNFLSVAAIVVAVFAGFTETNMIN